MRALTLTNDFHNTEAVVHPRVVCVNEWGQRFLGLTHSQVRRADRKLCGMPDCSCGGIAGERGGRYWLSLDSEDGWTVTRNTYVLHDGDMDGVFDELVERGPT